MQGLAEWLFGARRDGVGPEYCANCAKCGEACADGLSGRNGRFCPQTELKPETAEVLAIWTVLRGFGSWSGGGFTPARIDRTEVLRRCGVPDWITDPLVDVFEASAHRAMANAKDRKTKLGGKKNRKPDREN